MRFQVPQFIEIEDKIFGPLTLKQFIYVAGGAGLCVAMFYLLPIYISIILIVLVGALSLALAFYKVNNKPFVFLIENAFKYAFSNKLYVWKKTPKKIEPVQENEERDVNSLLVPKLSESKLHDLTWSLDINESMNPVTKNSEERKEV